LNSARARVSSARKYFNFLLNRELDSDIKVQAEFPELPDDTPTSALREELSMLRSSIEIQESALDLNKLSRLPKINAFLDIGTQATNWQFNHDSRYYLAGIQLSVPIFQGFRNNAQIRRSKLDVQRSSLDLEQFTAQFQVAADIARENLSTTQRNYGAASEQLKSARSYFNLIDKGYQQGVNSLIEYIDARNQLTSSELQLNIRQYEMLTAAAQLERETSSFNLSK
jgi:outer membrane protein